MHAEVKKALDHSLGLPVADAVYALVAYNHKAGNQTMRLELKELEVLASPEELERWETRSHKLRSDANIAWYEVQLDPNPSIQQLIAKLAPENPGFDERSYYDAINQAMFDLR